MAGVWSFLIILRVVEAVVAMDMDVVEVRTQNVMSVVNLVILHESVACALAHEAWEVVVVEAPVLAAVEVQVMGMGAGASNVFTPLWGYIYFLDRTLVRNFLVCSLIFLLCLHLHSHKHNAYKSSNRLELETWSCGFFFFSYRITLWFCMRKNNVEALWNQSTLSLLIDFYVSLWWLYGLPYTLLSYSMACFFSPTIYIGPKLVLGRATTIFKKEWNWKDNCNCYWKPWNCRIIFPDERW